MGRLGLGLHIDVGGGLAGVDVLGDEVGHIAVLHRDAGVLRLGQVLGQVPGEGVMLGLAVGLQGLLRGGLIGAIG